MRIPCIPETVTRGKGGHRLHRRSSVPYGAGGMEFKRALICQESQKRSGSADETSREVRVRRHYGTRRNKDSSRGQQEGTKGEAGTWLCDSQTNLSKKIARARGVAGGKTRCLYVYDQWWLTTRKGTQPKAHLRLESEWLTDCNSCRQTNIQVNHAVIFKQDAIKKLSQLCSLHEPHPFERRTEEIWASIGHHLRII